ncbi:ionotropic receptor 40a-like [Drosophila yakuba]|uniref:ionotropic receptor 40a-like n=1 Tax=Drosophila yakuba TaxID=7245 RepID=UPI001C8A5462|nr:ionotropic receptor 40a-like [Drosophila yakuba]
MIGPEDLSLRQRSAIHEPRIPGFLQVYGDGITAHRALHASTEVTPGRRTALVPPEEKSRQLHNIFQVARDNAERATAEQGRHYNLRRREWRPALGSLVLVRQHVLSNAAEGFAAKLAAISWLGDILVAIRKRCRPTLHADATPPRPVYDHISDETSFYSHWHLALTQIIRGLQPHSLAILALPSKDLSDGVCQKDRSVYLDDFLHRLHRSSYKSVVFSKAELFFQYIEENLQGANECISLILEEPKQLLNSLHDRHLAHRLSLFIFFWGARFPPSPRVISFKEPLRAVVLTRPRKKAFRIYYNQARPCSDSQLQLVNWYDGDNLGLQRIPLLPTALSVYANFQGRIFRVPVFHSPPWFWVTYCNYSSEEDEELNNLDSIEKRKVWVTGGRDHRLLTLLSKEMNFRFKYIEAPGRTQGSIRSENDRDLNDSFTGGIGLLQSGVSGFEPNIKQFNLDFWFSS